MNVLRRSRRPLRLINAVTTKIAKRTKHTKKKSLKKSERRLEPFYDKFRIDPTKGVVDNSDHEGAAP